MFDGNHRVRKDVNLSGRRQRQRTTTGKNGGTNGGNQIAAAAAGGGGVLEESRRQRDERRLQQLQQTSARTVQRITRGWSMRKRLVTELLQLTESSNSNKRSTLQLSLLLSLLPLLPSQQQQQQQQQQNNREVLLQYEQRLPLPKNEKVSIVSKQRIVQSAIKELIVVLGGDTGNNPFMLRILKYFLEEQPGNNNTPITMPTFLVLIQSCQEWMSSTAANAAAAANDNDNDDTTTHQQVTTLTLWQWACQAAAATTTNNTQLSLAYLGATLFGYTANSTILQQYQSVAATYFGIATATDDAASRRWSYQTLLQALMEEFVETSDDDDDDTTMTNDADTATTATSDSNRLLHDMVKDCESKIVCRAMELYRSLTSTSNHTTPTPNPHALLQLIDSLLSKPASRATVLLTCLQIRGDNVRSIVLEGRQEEEVKQQQMQDDDDDDDDDSDGLTTTASQKQNRKASSGARHTRQQIQTVPRLNQLYQDDLSQLRHETWTYFQNSSPEVRTNAVELAEQLSQASLWQQWGMVVLQQHPQPTSTTTSSNSTTKRAYLRLLGRLLQGCSGFRTMTTSPFLSQLAFSKPFLETLWRQCGDGGDEEITSWLSTTIFCDVFAHHLIALSDKDFLASYSNNTMASSHHGAISASSPSSTILAEHVVGKLKTLLYDLYWNKPVVASDVRVVDSSTAALRARLLLSGTKLWNALYERWTRLVRQAPFCDESTWWFPRLASRDDNGAVIGSRENNVGDDDDHMDIDESDEEEDVNENALENDALADTFRDPKMARVLTSIPQALPFDRRVKLFNSLLNADKVKTQDESADFRRAVARMMQRGEENEAMDMGGRERVEIRRDAMYFDSMDQLNLLGSRLKRKVQVTMVNKHGAQEAGIDGGGVFKEFLDDLIKEAFNPEADNTPRLFSVTPLQTLAVNMDAAYEKDILSHYEFLGRVLGKAVYESILVEPQFCLPFLNQLLGKLNSLEDLKNFDLEFYNNLTKMRHLSESDIESMGLSFELNVGTSRTVPLIPGGSKLPVTKQNVIHYIHLVAHQRLNIEGANQTKAFLRGFRDLIPASWVRLFSSYELQKMISGDDSVRGIDVQNLKEAMVYAGGYHQSQSMMKWFWEVIEELTPDHQRQFLRFMTSCSRQPLLGFRALEPLPCVQQIRVPEHLLASDETKKSVPLPSSSTCMNLLKLPNYNDKELLRKKLIAAIEAGAGFELT